MDRVKIFGEMGLIEHQPRLGDAVAKTDCKLAKVNEERFNYMVRAYMQILR